MEDIFGCLCVVTTEKHERKIRETLEDLAVSFHLKRTSDDSFKNLIDYFRRLSPDVLVIDDAALDDEHDTINTLLGYVPSMVREECKVVFLANPMRKKDDSVIIDLLFKNVTNFVLLRYLDTYEEAMDAIREAVIDDLTESKAVSMLQKLPDEPKQSLFSRKKAEPRPDVLLTESTREPVELDSQEVESEELKKILSDESSFEEKTKAAKEEEVAMAKSTNNTEFVNILENSSTSVEKEHQSDAKLEHKENADDKTQESTMLSGRQMIQPVDNLASLTDTSNFDDLDPRYKEFIAHYIDRKFSTIAIEGLNLEEFYVCGDQHGVGTTHVALCIALSVASNQPTKKVFFVADEQDLIATFESKSGLFASKGVHFISAEIAESERLNKGNVIVYDLGALSGIGSSIDLLIKLKAARALICVYSGNPWDSVRTENLLKRIKSINSFNNLIMAANHTPTQTKDALKHLLDALGKTNVKHFTVPNSPNFLVEGSKINANYGNLYHQILKPAKQEEV